MDVEIAGRAKTLDQGDRACVRILHLKPGLLDEEGGYHAMEDAQYRRLIGERDGQLGAESATAHSMDA